VAVDLAVEAKVEQALPGGVAAGEGQQAVADVAGRQHRVSLAQLAGTTAVVGNGDDGRQPLALGRGKRNLFRGEIQRPQAFQQRRQAIAAAERDDARQWFSRVRHEGFSASGKFQCFFHRMFPWLS
jgi:hypothetical protein